MTAHSRADETVGTFVLGLEASDVRADFRSHLDLCDVCRAEWQRLRDLPPLLAMAAQLQRPLDEHNVGMPEQPRRNVTSILLGEVGPLRCS